MNKANVNRLKKRLEGAKGKWVEDLPNVLWAYCTLPRKSMDETPFSMTYGIEVVIPIRVSDFSLENINAYVAEQLDLLEEH